MILLPKKTDWRDEATLQYVLEHEFVHIRRFDAVTKLLHLELPEASFDYFQSTQSMLLALLYTCVLAPVTEELLFRGFLMKSLSAVSVRFGIVTSALLFGLMHGNFQQFILGFVMGLFLGKIVARHNSLLPSILVHMAVNTNSMVLSLLQEKLPEKAERRCNGISGLQGCPMSC